MKIYQIIFVVIYLAALISYFFSETSGNFKRRAVNKILLASLFLIYGLTAFGAKRELMSCDGLLYAAIVFSFWGDVVLLFSFTGGGVLFMLGNTLFFAYEITLCIRNGISAWQVALAAVLFAVPVAIMWLLSAQKYVDFGKKAPALMAYLSSVTLHGSLGAAIIAGGAGKAVSVMCSGLILFAVSDYFLMLHTYKYKNSKLMLRLNSGTYFVGLMLVVLSLTV